MWPGEITVVLFGNIKLIIKLFSKKYFAIIDCFIVSYTLRKDGEELNNIITAKIIYTVNNPSKAPNINPPNLLNCLIIGS